MKRLASIDIGSNSMHLCVADILPTGEWKILEVLRSSIQLGCYDPLNPGAMHPGRMNEAIEALLAFSARASLLHATSFSAAATAAVREASNQEEFQALFETELGFPSGTSLTPGWDNFAGLIRHVDAATGDDSLWLVPHKNPAIIKIQNDPFAVAAAVAVAVAPCRTLCLPVSPARSAWRRRR